jgi:hypothetical protein
MSKSPISPQKTTNKNRRDNKSLHRDKRRETPDKERGYQVATLRVKQPLRRKNQQ